MSRLIKSSWVPGEFSTENKVISIRSVRSADHTDHSSYHAYESMQERERIIEEAKREAAATLEHARRNAQLITEQMEMEKNQFNEQLLVLADEARQNGFLEGIEQGRFQGLQEASTYIEEAKETVRLSKLDYLNKLDAGEATILNIALQVAEKIIGESLTDGPEKFLPVVKKALKEARDYKEIQLHIHPSNYEFLLAQKEDLIRIFPKETELYIFPDADLHEHDCIIESANGRIDASVDQQLNEIKTKLYELLESE